MHVTHALRSHTEASHQMCAPDLDRRTTFVRRRKLEMTVRRTARARIGQGLAGRVFGPGSTAMVAAAAAADGYPSLLQPSPCDVLTSPTDLTHLFGPNRVKRMLPQRDSLFGAWCVCSLRTPTKTRGSGGLT